MGKWTEQQKKHALTMAEATTCREAALHTGIPEGSIKRWRSEIAAKSDPNEPKIEPSRKKKNEPRAKRTAPEPKVEVSVPDETSVDGHLNARQKMFVKEYIIDMNATQAAIRAGYSAETAYVTGPRLLSNVRMSVAIENAIAERERRMELTADWVLERFKLISDRCVQGEPVLDREGNPIGEWKFDATGANKATEMIGKHLGMFKDKVEIEHSGGIKTTQEYHIIQEIIEKDDAVANRLLDAMRDAKV